MEPPITGPTRQHLQLKTWTINGTRNVESGKPILTHVPEGQDVRDHYMRLFQSQEAPYLSYSGFVSLRMVEHLMRHKKDSALGVKFVPGNRTPDQITNMEGAMHTFVTPVLFARMHGDYHYEHGHGVRHFKICNGYQPAREVIVSAVIQPDFETDRVMLRLASVKYEPSIGRQLQPGTPILDVQSKQQTATLAAYEESLRLHLIAHLTKSRSLPSRQQVGETLSPNQAPDFLASEMMKSEDLEQSFINSYIALPAGHIISIEILFNSAVQQLRNELSMLESLCLNGYVYTWDPPAIFARYLGASILTRILLAALKHLATCNSFPHMRTFAFNDYADQAALKILRHVLSTHPHIKVTAKRELFPGGRYEAPSGMEGATLVLHNNSDAFGQNIETEGPYSSMDGAIGANSSAAATLHRQRPDLLSRAYCCA